MSDALHKSRTAQRAIRAQGRAARRSLGDDERRFASRSIAEQVFAASWFRRARHIACYLSTDDEVDTWPIFSRAWRMNKRIFAPVVDRNLNMRFVEVTANTDLLRSRFGAYEPRDGFSVHPSKLDIVLAPLVAFDDRNNRVGMGGGCYDRTFAFLNHRQCYFRPRLIGLAFACQQVEKIAANPWDIRLSGVLSERK